MAEIVDEPLTHRSAATMEPGSGSRRYRRRSCQPKRSHFVPSTKFFVQGSSRFTPRDADFEPSTRLACLVPRTPNEVLSTGGLRRQEHCRRSYRRATVSVRPRAAVRRRSPILPEPATRIAKSPHAHADVIGRTALAGALTAVRRLVNPVASVEHFRFRTRSRYVASDSWRH